MPGLFSFGGENRDTATTDQGTVSGTEGRCHDIGGPIDHRAGTGIDSRQDRAASGAEAGSRGRATHPDQDAPKAEAETLGLSAIRGMAKTLDRDQRFSPPEVALDFDVSAPEHRTPFNPAFSMGRTRPISQCDAGSRRFSAPDPDPSRWRSAPRQALLVGLAGALGSERRSSAARFQTRSSRLCRMR